MGGGSGRLELGYLLFRRSEVASFLGLGSLRVLFVDAEDLADAVGAEVVAAGEPPAVRRPISL